MVKSGRVNKTITALVAFIALFAFIQIPLFISDDSEAAESSATDISIVMFDQDSADYNNLVYLSDELPLQFNPAEWVRDDISGLWYNINKSSSYYGKLLRYGYITGMTDDEIRSDVHNHYPVFYGTNFIVAQVECKTIGDCAITVSIEKEGVSKIDQLNDAPADISGYYVDGEVERAYLYSVGSFGDIIVTTSAGYYSVTIKCNGASSGSASINYGGSACTLSGMVYDAGNSAGGRGIPYTLITYKVTDLDGNEIRDGSVVTDSNGAYSFTAERDVNVNITSVSASGFTFDRENYSFGKVIGDAVAAPFTANENRFLVTVTDQSGRPAPDVLLRSAWYTSVDNGGGTYTISASLKGIEIPYATDANGKAVVIISEIVPSAKLYIRGEENEYSFTVNSKVNIGQHNYDLPATVTEDGNAYGNITTYADINLKADDYSVMVNTKGNLDSSSSGGATLQGVRLNAVWYYQKEDTGNFTIRESDAIEDGTFVSLKPGKAWFKESYSSDDGKVLLHYIIPVWLAAAGESSYLYIYACEAAASSSSADFTFTYVLPTDGTESVTDIANGYPTCSALLSSSVSETTVRSDEVAYAINGGFYKTNMADEFPASLTVYCITSSNVGMSRTVVESGGQMRFQFSIKEGLSCVIEVDDAVGYYMSNQKQEMPDAFSNLVFSCNITEVPAEIDRYVPAMIDEYTVTGLSSGNVITFKFKVGTTDLTVLRRSTGDSVVYPITGWSGNTVTNLVVSGEGIFIGEMSGNTINAAVLKEVKFVTYYNESSNSPEIYNVVGGQTVRVYYGDSLFTTLVTDINGRATVTVPDSSELSYRYGDLAITSSAVTTGAYLGCCGLNLKDVMESPLPKEAVVTVRYIATSSLQNESEATNIDILSGPESIRLTVGEKKTFTAPDVGGFEGWFINGESVSNSRNPHVCDIEITEDMDGAILTASYSAITPDPPKENIGTTIAIGVLSVTLALIALIYVILQIKRY